jgi:hypothetical protein
MKCWTLSLIGVVTLVGIGLAASSAIADQDKQLSVSVAFGRGLNTATPGNPVNHVILPNNIKIKEGGVVHFLVAGFHQISVYNPGTGPEDIVVPPPPPPGGNPFINDATNRFYQGINPAGGAAGYAGEHQPLERSKSCGIRGLYGAGDLYGDLQCPWSFSRRYVRFRKSKGR